MIGKYKIIRNQKGLTLIELIIALGILSIVLVMAFNIFSFNLRTFGRGEVQSEVQFDVRMAADYITYQTRNARNISTSSFNPSSAIGLTELQNRFDSIETVEFRIVEEDSRYFLEYDIRGFRQRFNTEYEMTSRVLLNNISSGDDESGPILYYNKDY